MKPFNLEEAKAGAPVCTADGHKVRIICWDAKIDKHPIIALISPFDPKCSEGTWSYMLNGKIEEDGDHRFDLVMVDEEDHYDISNFKPFDKVLVRDNIDETWRAAIYSHYEIDENVPFQVPFITVSYAYIQCIPYNEETEHLVGTTEMPPKKYINW